MPEVILVVVQKCDSENAQICNSRNCLVARAIARHFDTNVVHVGSFSVNVSNRVFDLDNAGIQLVQAFDLHDVHPQRMPELPVTIALTERVP